MALPRGLAGTILRYRKRNKRSLSPTIPSYAGQYDTAKPVTRVPGDTRAHNTNASRPTSYMDGTREDYFPHPGFMEIPRSEYEAFDRDLVEDMPRMGSQGIDALRHIAPALREFDHVEHVRYEDCLMEKDFFEHQMRLLREQFEEDQSRSFEHNDIVERALAENEQGAELRANIDLIEKMLDIEQLVSQVESVAADPRMILEKIGTLSDTMSQPETSEAADYAMPEPQEYFEQQMQMMEAQLFQLEHTQFDHGSQMEMMFDAQEAAFDAIQPEGVAMEQATVEQSIEEMMLSTVPGGQSLEQVVQANEVQDATMTPNDMSEMPSYGDCLMSQDIFEQQMHEAAEEMAPEQADPCEDEMVQEQMYDEQMPEDMMDPSMMPGPMGPGAMGPEFMPGPGPMM